MYPAVYNTRIGISDGILCSADTVQYVDQASDGGPLPIPGEWMDIAGNRIIRGAQEFKIASVKMTIAVPVELRLELEKACLNLALFLSSIGLGLSRFNAYHQ